VKDEKVNYTINTIRKLLLKARLEYKLEKLEEYEKSITDAYQQLKALKLSTTTPEPNTGEGEVTK
jgi:hypothetical protein